MRDDVENELAEKGKTLNQVVSQVKEPKKIKNGMEEIRKQMGKIDAQRGALEMTPGTLNEEEIQRLKDQKQAFQKQLQEKKKKEKQCIPG